MPPAYEILLLNTAIPQIQAAQSGDTYVVPRAIAFNAGVNVVNNDVTIYGLTVGRGAGAVSTNTAVGASALVANGAGNNNTAVGYQAGYLNQTGAYNVFVGNGAGSAVLSGGGNCFVGPLAGLLSTGSSNTFVGSLVVGVSNGSSAAMTTGSKNTILGNFSGNQGGVDIRALDNNVVISDGDGNPKFMFRPGNGFYLYSTGSLNVNLSVPNGSKNTAQNLITSANLFPNQNWGGGAILLIQSAATDSIAGGYVRTEIISVLQRFGTYSVVSLASNVLDGLGMTNWTYSYDGSYFKITQNWTNTATLISQFNIVNITGALSS